MKTTVSDETQGRPAELDPRLLSDSQQKHHNDANRPRYPTTEQWSDVLDIINIAVRGAYQSSPAFDPTEPNHFFAYWRAVFAWLHSSVIEDSGIPTQLASPSVPELELRFLPAGKDGEEAYCPSCRCRCCFCFRLDDTILRPGGILLRNHHGLKKGDLVRAVGEYLFSDSGAVGSLGPALPYEAGWVENTRSIWILCCSPEQLPEKVAGGAKRPGHAEATKCSKTVRIKSGRPTKN